MKIACEELEILLVVSHVVDQDVVLHQDDGVAIYQMYHINYQTNDGDDVPVRLADVEAEVYEEVKVHH